MGRFAPVAFPAAWVGLVVLAGCGGGGTRTGGDLSVGNVLKVKIGMTVDEAARILGAGPVPATAADLEAVNAKIARFGKQPIERREDATLHYWYDGNAWFFVDVDAAGKVVSSRRWASS